MNDIFPIRINPPVFRKVLILIFCVLFRKVLILILIFCVFRKVLILILIFCVFRKVLILIMICVQESFNSDYDLFFFLENFNSFRLDVLIFGDLFWPGKFSSNQFLFPIISHSFVPHYLKIKCLFIYFCAINFLSINWRSNISQTHVAILCK